MFYDQVSNFTTVFLGIFLQSAPFLFLGALSSGVIEVFFEPEELLRLVPRSSLGASLVGGLVGIFFPVSGVGALPLARRWFRKGLPMPAAMAFLLAAPILNPIVIAGTLGAWGLGPLLFSRLGLTLGIAVLAGLVFSLAGEPGEVLRPSSGALSPTEASPATFRQRISSVLTLTADEFFEFGGYLVAGALLAAFVQLFIAQSFLVGLAHSPLASALAAAGLGVLYAPCAALDAFTALGFAGALPGGALAVLLVVGPLLDVKRILMLFHVFHWRTGVYLLLLPLALAVFAGVALDLFGVW